MNGTIHLSAETIAQAGQLLEQAGIPGPFRLVPLSGGANSKAFRIELGTGQPRLFYKEYFHHPDDSRDRLGTEFAFVSFVWDHGLRTLARPLAMNRDRHCALYSFLDGRKVEPHEVTRELLEQCLQFFAAINAYKDSPAAARLPVASEACFTLGDHLGCLQRRVMRFEQISPATMLDREALAFLRAELAPACVEQMRIASNLAVRLGIEAEAAIADADRCLSPSDFGFHNALRRADGVLQFLDFEYAGWDDPAKTVCDFFCQPACPAPGEFYAEFANRIAEMTLDPMRSRRRFDLLLPIYRLKWCCIMLNDFVPAGGSRRRFAIHGMDEAARKTLQLEKARIALDRCMSETSIELAA